jgi:hypothetical protein
MHPLIQEAMKKAAVAWLTAPGVTGGYAVWCLWVDDGLHLVTGDGEQPAPGLAGAGTVDVSVRGDHGGRILTWPASVNRIEPGGPEWDTIAPQLAAKRLNAPGPTDETVARWATTCQVYRLAPVADPVEAGPSLSDASGAEPPRPTPAANHTPKPFRLHRVRGAR